MTERADDGGDVALVGVDFGVKVAHFFGGDFAGEVGQHGTKRWKFGEGVAANDGDGVVWREVVAVVGEGYEVEGVDQAIGGIAGDDIDFFVDQSTVD